MTLIQAWKDSLNLCKPATLKLMFLVTLNSMKEVLRVLCTPWFLIPASVLAFVSFLIDSLLFASVAYMFVSIFMFLAVRPSIRLKDGAYFKEYCFLYTKFLATAVLLLCASLLSMLIIFKMWLMFLFWIGYIPTYPTTVFFLFNQSDDFITWMPVLLIMIISAFYGMLGLVEYTAFFYLDHIGSAWNSFKKALVLITYNIPMLVVYLGIALCIKFVYWLLVTLIAGFLLGASCSINASFFAACAGIRYSLLGLPPYLFSVCLFINIYTKRVHDQYSLYQ